MIDPQASALASLQTAVDGLKGVSSALDAAVQALKIVTIEVDTSGTVDVTDAIQAYLDRAGHQQVPAGRYLIDPLKSLRVRSGTKLELDPEAVFIAKPNAAIRYAVFKVEAVTDVEITGGQILGDRATHDFTKVVSTHEWGYGIQIKGARIKVSGLKVSGCTGDGLSVSGNDIELRGVVSTNNRRQGMSVFNVENLRVYDSEFTRTNGTAPQAGVDIEPDAGSVTNVLFDGCLFNDNATAGLLLWTRSGTGASITGIEARNCTMANNANGVHAKGLAGPIVTISLNGCLLSKNRGSGARIESGANLAIDGCTFEAVTDRADFTLTGTSTKTANDTRVLTGGAATVGTNTYK